MEKHLDDNPEIKTAINEIEAANENYNEDIFKAKCKRYVFCILFMLISVLKHYNLIPYSG